MLVALAFIAVFSLGFMALSVFKKHMLINMAVVFLMFGGLYVVEISGWPAKIWIESSFVMIIIYQITEMSKLKIK